MLSTVVHLSSFLPNAEISHRLADRVFSPSFNPDGISEASTWKKAARHVSQEI